MIEIHLTEQQAGAILGINIERRGDIESKLTRWLADDNQNPWSIDLFNGTRLKASFRIMSFQFLLHGMSRDGSDAEEVLKSIADGKRMLVKNPNDLPDYLRAS